MVLHLKYSYSSKARRLCTWIVFFFLIAACDDVRHHEDGIGHSNEVPSIMICHAAAEGAFRLQEQHQRDLPTHLLHGDGIPGGSIPSMAGFVFSEMCQAVKDSDESPCLTGMAYIDGFCIDRWEANLKDRSPYEVPTDGLAQTADGVVPQGYISGEMAEAACHAVGKRLCTSQEWLRTCQGSGGMTFPYGNTHIASACNEGRDLHPIIELFGEAADWSSRQMNDARINQLPNTLDVSGSNPVCMSAEGVYDLHGNLHEWVADADGTFRGGFYVDAEINGKGCLYRTTAHGRAYHDYSTGFRCCSDAK